MAKKSMKEVAAAGTSVFEQLTNNHVQDALDVQDTQDIKNVKDIQDAKSAQDKADKIPYERLNLRIPADIKEYLTIAAAKASIDEKRNISLTEYLCDLVRKDMEKDK